MSKIKIHDKTFEPFIAEEIIQAAVENIAQQITGDYKGKTPLFLCVLNGSFMFAADLFKVYGGPAEISFIRLSSYQGTATTEEIKTVIGLTEEIAGRDLIVLEDIIDSGLTVMHLMEELAKHHPSSMRIASLLLKPKALRTDIKPDYIGLEIPNDFIVGYGLDYDGLGRNLKDIYKIVE